MLNEKKKRVFTMSMEELDKKITQENLKEKIIAKIQSSDKVYNIQALMVQVFKYDKATIEKNMSQWKKDDEKFYYKVRGVCAYLVRNGTIDSKKVEGKIWFFKKK